MRATAATPDTLARDHPEWRPWLALLAEARRALDDPLWARAVPGGTNGVADPRPSSAVPLVHGLVLAVDARAADAFVRRLLEVAGTGSGSTTTLRAAAGDDHLDALALLEAAICQDVSRLDDCARRLDVGSALLRAVAAVAATPLLHACRRVWEDRLPASWVKGYCPVCGGWPTLGEARGLERSFRLRCVRCGGDWRGDWLRCSYCGNVDHTTLGSLIVDAVLDARKIETCEVCRGYLKTITTLQATAADAVALIDLALVELDIAALEHGYARPEAPACGLSARVVPTTA